MALRDRTSEDAPICLTRLELPETRFIAESDGGTDGVVINHRFDSPPHGDSLKRAALAARMPFLIDLESWRLPFLADSEDDSFGTDARTPIGKAAPLPLHPKLLADPARAQHLVRTAAQVQGGATLSFAPDFQIASLEDPYLGVNIACARLMRELAPRENLALAIHVSLEAMLTGFLPYVAERYRQELELATGTFLVLTVSDVRPTLPPADLAIYFLALEAFENAGFHVIVDRASEVSIPAVAGFASGCMLGNRIYRTAPASPRFELDYNPKIRLRFLDGELARTLPRELARERHERGDLDCSREGCEAVTATSKKRLFELRFHAAHGMRDSIHAARADGLGSLRGRWREAKQKHLRGFAQALALVEERRKEA